jgi:formamidopyrimidine-DNA glycosylase
VKNFLMDQRVVVGVGNIYAAEALFLPPASRRICAAGSRCRARATRRLADSVTRQSSTTRSSAAAPPCATSSAPDGAPGYFEQELSGIRPRRRALPALRTRRCGRRWSASAPSVWCGHVASAERAAGAWRNALTNGNGHHAFLIAWHRQLICRLEL